jgi:hypothetical protein
MLAAALTPTCVLGAEPAAVAYRSAFEGYRTYDAAYEQVDWRQANAAVAATPHEQTHSTEPSESSATPHRPPEPRDVATQNEVDPGPAADPHAGHRE